MKLNNLIFALAAVAAIMLVPLKAQAQADGWTREYSTMNFDTLYLDTTGGADQGNWFVRTKFLGNDVSDKMVWAKGGFDVPFEGTLSIGTRSFASTWGMLTMYGVWLYHGDTAISSEFIISGNGPWGHAVYGPPTWSGTLAAFDSLSIVEVYHPFTSVFVEQTTDFDNFRVTIAGQNFLFYQAGDVGQISGTLWHDVDNNAVKDPGEEPLEGRRVRLYDESTLIDSLTTDAEGRYLFQDLPHATYELEQVLPSGWQATYPVGRHRVTIGIDTLQPILDFGSFIPTGQPYLVRKGWNLVSLPLLPPDPTKTEVYPSSISRAFSYEGAYVPQDSLNPGQGYWLKFNRQHNVWLVGDPIYTCTTQVSEGWNMIGGISNPIALEDLYSNPPGLITSGAWGYEGRYVEADTLKPNKGYWLKLESAGELIASTVPGGGRITVIRTGAKPPPPPEEHVVGSQSLASSDFALNHSYPNPFNPSTTIEYRIPKSAHVSLKVFNLLGQEVAELVNERKQAGAYSVQWDARQTAGGLASGLPGGIYFYRLQANEFVQTKKLVLIR